MRICYDSHYDSKFMMCMVYGISINNNDNDVVLMSLYSNVFRTFSGFSVRVATTYVKFYEHRHKNQEQQQQNKDERLQHTTIYKYDDCNIII